MRLISAADYSSLERLKIKTIKNLQIEFTKTLKKAAHLSPEAGRHL